MNWPDTYNTYLEFYQKGLKKDAKSIMKIFISSFSNFPIREKRKFADDVFSKAFDTGKYSMYIPRNLYNEILLPEINNWIHEEPDNPVPKKWSDDLLNVKMSIEINPDDQIALEIFARGIIGRISMNQHEIVRGFPYDGDPLEDIVLIDFFVKYIDNILDERRREELKVSLNELRDVAIRYI